MADLTAHADYGSDYAQVHTHLAVKAGELFYDGALVARDAAGLHVNAADAAGLTVVGVATTSPTSTADDPVNDRRIKALLDNTNGVDGVYNAGIHGEGDRLLRVERGVLRDFASSGAATPKPGDVALVLDNQTFTVTAAEAVNDIVLGVVQRPGHGGRWQVWIPIS